MLKNARSDWVEPASPGGGELTAADISAVWRGVWLNSILLSLAFGACCGAAVVFATYLSLAVTGENAGYYLHLLGVFLPGYTVTPGGAWIGFFWAFLFAALSGFVVYQIYVRAVGIRALRRLIAMPPGDAYWRMTMRLSGRALGLALGVMLALQLVLSTTWLVVRGTAGESRHAALLSNYLPGYSVSIPGSLIGGGWLFLYAFVASLLLAKVYNTIVDRRAARGTRHD
jgi:hypothetical protein